MQKLKQLLKRHWRTVCFVLAAFAVGVLVGSSFLEPARNHAIYRKQGALTNSLLGFEVDTHGEFQELNPIRNALEQVLQEKEGGVKTASIYFRLLNSGRWFSINPEETYSPASLLKIPIMMAFYKQAEENPSILEQRIYNDGRYSAQEQSTVPEEQRLTPYTNYTIDDLIGRMIRDSNNEAKFLLEENLSPDFVSTIYEDLDMRDPADVGMAEDYMKVVDYPFFLRLLYNTTYLNQKYSEKGLNLLTESSFTEGLPALLPSGIPVAHKFGFRIVPDTNPQIGELHDCGIVYYPDHPYILCVMTKGYAREPLTTLIQDASLVTYQEVEKFFK